MIKNGEVGYAYEMNLFERIGIDQPKVVSDVKLSEEVDTSRVIELLDPKYKLSNQVVSLIQKYLGYKSVCQVDTYSQNNVVGRLYSNSSSQYLPSEVRNTLFPHSYDIDITCCAPTIIKNILEKLNIPCPKLNYYITHRKKILSSLAKEFKLEEWEVKALFNAILNGQGYNKTIEIIDDVFVIDFWKECKGWRLELNSLLPQGEEAFYQYSDEKKQKRLEEKESTQKDQISGLIYDIENRILCTALKFLESKKIKVRCLVFDGLIADSDDFDFKELNKHVYEQTSFKIEFISKSMTNRYFDKVPKDKKFNYDLFQTFRSYESAKAYFEEHWAVVDHPYVLVSKNDPSIFRKFKLSDFKNHFPLEFSYQKQVGNKTKTVKTHFWDLHKTQATKYESLDFLPPPLNKTIKKYTFNLFNGFEIEKTLDADESFDTSVFYEHLKHLVNYDDDCYNYLVDYLAHIVQLPGERPDVCLIFKGTQGTGKNLFFELFGDNILGQQYRLTAENPDHVLGKFNLNHNKLIVVLDEMKCSKATSEQLKALITAPTLNFEKKGVDGCPIRNMGRYFMFTNNDIPVKIEENDRRFVVFETSNKYLGSINTSYFKNLAECLSNPKKMRKFYNELMNKEITTDFRKDRPKTQIYADIQELTSKDLLDQFIEDYREDSNNKSELVSGVWYEKFKDWLFQNDQKNFNITQATFIKKLVIRNVLDKTKKSNGQRFYGLTEKYKIIEVED